MPVGNHCRGMFGLALLALAAAAPAPAATLGDFALNEGVEVLRDPDGRWTFDEVRGAEPGGRGGGALPRVEGARA